MKQSKQPLEADPATQIRRGSLHHTVADRVRDMIVEGQLTPGERIREAELCLAFGISRTPLREALKVLASEGLIELRANRGSRVSPITDEEVGDLFEALSGIERHSAELAAERVNEAGIQRLRAMHERMDRHWKKRNRPAYAKVNHEIHRTIVGLARNEALVTIHDSLMARLRRARYMALMSDERWAEAVEEHEGILAALESGEARLAGERLCRHVLRTGEVVRAQLAESGLLTRKSARSRQSS